MGGSGSNGQNEIGTEDELSGWRGTVTGINRVAYTPRVKPPYIPPLRRHIVLRYYFYTTHNARSHHTYTVPHTTHAPPPRALAPACLPSKGSSMGPGEGQVQRLFDDIVEDELGRDDRRHVRDAGLPLRDGERRGRCTVLSIRRTAREKGSRHGAGERARCTGLAKGW